MMKTTVVNAVIDRLQKFYSVFGLPTKLVSDNGPPFNSNVFRKYCEMFGIVFENSPPYHSQSNGLAERGVQTAKKCFIRFCLGKESELSIQDKIDKYLLWSRNTPSVETGRSPAELVFAFKPRVILDNVNDFLYKEDNLEIKNKKTIEVSDVEVNTTETQVKQSFQVNDKVFYRCHFKSWIKWMPAFVKKMVSPLTYLIEVNNQIRYVQENQLRYPSKKDKHFVYSPITPNDQNIDETPRSLVTNNDNIPMESDAGNIDNDALENITQRQNQRRQNVSAQLGRTPKRTTRRVIHYGNNIYDH